MKINDKTKCETVPFSFLADGAVFRNKNGSICLKFPISVYELGYFNCYNAYDLTNDEFTWFSLSDRVEKVQTELVLLNS